MSNNTQTLIDLVKTFTPHKHHMIGYVHNLRELVIEHNVPNPLQLTFYMQTGYDHFIHTHRDTGKYNNLDSNHDDCLFMCSNYLYHQYFGGVKLDRQWYDSLCNGIEMHSDEWIKDCIDYLLAIRNFWGESINNKLRDMYIECTDELATIRIAHDKKKSY